MAKTGIKSCPRRVILVVEDQVVTRQLEISILETAGDEVVFAENGLDALEKLGRQNFGLAAAPDAYLDKSSFDQRNLIYTIETVLEK